MDNLLRNGIQAPDFELNAAPGQTLRLSNLRGRPVVLAFYPADWSPVCGDQLGLYNEALYKLKPYNAQLLGIAVDSEWCHQAYRMACNFKFPLLADFEPKGKISRLYKSYNAERGASSRSLYVIDDKGTIRWSYLSPEDVNPGMNGILHALREISGQKTPCEDNKEFDEGDHIRGAHTARITLLEYGDYECTHCKAAHEEVSTVLKHFDLKIRYIFKNFPLTENHPHALTAAEAAESAGGMGKFWEMHDTLFAHQDDLEPDSILEYAKTLGLNTKQMAQDIKTHCWVPRIEADFENGIERGVNGTPSFFINDKRHDGSYDADTLIEALTQELETASRRGNVSGNVTAIPIRRKTVSA